jgi:hypothetical protein
MAARAAARLGRATLLAAAVWAAAGWAGAGELRLFDGSARPRYFTPPATGEDSELRLFDLEHSYPWGGGDPGFRLVADAAEPETQESPEQPPGLSPSPAPKKFWNTTTTVWTGLALLGGMGQGLVAPIRYGTNAWHFTNEGWFGYTTYAGGADKVSHFIISSGVSRLLYDISIQNGQPVEKSFWVAFAATLTAGIFVETGDAVTVYGWSWQDFTADFLGGLSGVLIHRYGLQDTLGLRVGPAGADVPDSAVGSSAEYLGTSYNDEIYAGDLKLGGFIRHLHGNPGFARYFLVSMVYYTRGYGYVPPLPSRYQAMGFELGINFPEILEELRVPRDQWWGQTLYAFFNFFRIPYTQIGTYYNFRTKKWYGPSAPYHYYP